MIGRERIYEMMRFGMVGVAATAIHYGIYYVLLGYFNPSVSYTVGYCVSFLCNYVLSSLFTFRVSLCVGGLFRFAISHVINYLVGVLLLNVFIWLGMPAEWAPLPVFMLVVPINFLLVRFALKKKM